MNTSRRRFLHLGLATLAVAGCARVEPRDAWFRYRIPAYGAFRRHYRPLYRIAALANYWNLRVYDVLLTDPHPLNVEGPFHARLERLALRRRLRLDPHPEVAAPRFSRLAWGVSEAFMWSHHLHENAFDAYAAPGLSPRERYRMVEEATEHYLRNPRAFAPVEVPMRRLHALPFHGTFASRYPKVNGLIWAGHQVHAGVYDGQLAVLHGERTVQDVIEEVEATFVRQVREPPTEHPHFSHAAPRFTELHPRAAAIFANMHMLHDLAGDILADRSIEDPRATLFETRDLMLTPPREPEVPHAPPHARH